MLLGSCEVFPEALGNMKVPDDAKNHSFNVAKNKMPLYPVSKMTRHGKSIPGILTGVR